MKASHLLLAAASVMKATDLAKEVVRRTTGLEAQPYLKSAFSVAVAAVAAVAVGENRKERALLVGGVAAGSAFLHEAYAVMTTTSDRNLRSSEEMSFRTQPRTVAAVGLSSAGPDVEVLGPDKGTPRVPRAARTGPRPRQRGSRRPEL